MKASVFIATSLDGFIARENGALDWLPPNGGEPHGYIEFMATVDALVIGRKTFETVLTFDHWPYDNKPVVVLTSRPTDLVAPANAVCEIMAGSPPEVVAHLSEGGMKHLYIYGGAAIQRFFEVWVIQQVINKRKPRLL